jgi:hypothetical protein
MIRTRENRSTVREECVPLLLCPPQIPSVDKLAAA